MSFYRNLKLLLDELELSNYEAGMKCGIPPQTIDYQINNKVTKPKVETLKKLSKGLDVSINKLMYGTDTFVSDIFYSTLSKKNVSFEELIYETNADPVTLLRNEIPTMKQQESISAYLGIKASEIFKPSRFAIDYLKAKNVKPYIRPDINSDPNSDEDMLKLYSNLSSTAKRVVYNLAYDLSVIETENIVTLTPKDYWEK